MVSGSDVEMAKSLSPEKVDEIPNATTVPKAILVVHPINAAEVRKAESPLLTDIPHAAYWTAHRIGTLGVSKEVTGE